MRLPNIDLNYLSISVINLPLILELHLLIIEIKKWSRVCVYIYMCIHVCVCYILDLSFIRLLFSLEIKKWYCRLRLRLISLSYLRNIRSILRSSSLFCVSICVNVFASLSLSIVFFFYRKEPYLYIPLSAYFSHIWIYGEKKHEQYIYICIYISLHE